MKEKANEDMFSPLFQGNFGINKSNDYTTIFQNNATNQIAQLNTKRHTKKLPLGQIQVSFKDITALFKGDKLDALDAQMFDYILIKYSQTSNHDNLPTVVFKLKEYMHDRKLRDAKSARKTLRKEVAKFADLKVSYSGGNDKSQYDHPFVIQNIFSKTGYVNGTAFFTFTPEISVLLSTDHAMLMPYHRLLLEINTNREPTAWYLFRRLLLNKRTNFGNSARADRMKISTLLKGCPSLPTYEEVMAGNRHVDDRIIQPFFKAIERLSDAFEYTYLTASGKPFNYKEGITYQDFASGELVITSWKDYPDSWLQQLKASKNKHRKGKRLNKN